MQTAAPLYPTNNPPIKSFQHATTTIPNDIFTELSFEDSLEQLNIASIPFVGSFFDTSPDWKPLVDALVHNQPITHDPLWQQIQAQATQALQPEPEAGPQLYQGILSHSNLVDAICGIVANEIETSLMPATALKNLFTATLTPHDVVAIHLDVMAVATKSASIQNMAMACLFHKGLQFIRLPKLEMEFTSMPVVGLSLEKRQSWAMMSVFCRESPWEERGRKNWAIDIPKLEWESFCMKEVLF